jgi:hypothetical protein
MKSLLVLLLGIALVALGPSACGGTGKGTRSAPGVTSKLATSAGAETPTASGASPARRYLNDGDAEKLNDNDPDNSSGNHEDGDADSHEEYESTYDNTNYHDGDDTSVLTYGHAAGAAEARAVAAVVKRYYAAAAVGDGATACSMILPTLAKAIPEDYARPTGPVYLRGGKTCRAVMSRLFKHFHDKLAGAIEVTGVRVEGNLALALLGSRTRPASEMSVERIGGAWKIALLLANALR